MIIAYYMIRSLELEHAADRNRQELTMEIILLFFQAALVPVAVTIALFGLDLLKRSGAYRGLSSYTMDNIVIGIPTLVLLLPTLWLSVRAIDIIGQVMVLNDNLSEQERNLPTQSHFVQLIYFIMVILVIGVLLILIPAIACLGCVCAATVASQR